MSKEHGRIAEDGGRAFNFGGRVLAGSLLGLLLIGGVGGWAATAELTGAVIAQGQVAVDQNLKSIQHRDGGIVSEIAIRQGDTVEAGEVLLRLEDAQTRAELSIVEAQLVELAARKARLLAERDDLPALVFPPSLDPEDPETAFFTNGEKRLFAGNRTSRESQKSQLELGIDQIGEEIKGLEAQLQAKDDEYAIVEGEHEKIKGLAEKRLIEASRVHASERDLARLLGEHGEVIAAIARAKTRIGEIRLQILAVDETARTEAQRELGLLETKMSELSDRRIAILDRLSRTDIRAPIAGTINELNIHTIGGVITPAEVLVTLVPEDAKLKVQTRFSPASIDQIGVGQDARLRFSAFNQRTTPELQGTLTYVSAATTRDEATGEIYYRGDIEIEADELAKLGDEQVLVPGMPVEVFIQTQERTALSYLFKPIEDQFAKAMRER
jgi:HlyD family secretion protein